MKSCIAYTNLFNIITLIGKTGWVPFSTQPVVFPLISRSFFFQKSFYVNELYYFFKSKAFDNSREKIVADITFKVLQVQQIPLFRNAGAEEDCDEC